MYDMHLNVARQALETGDLPVCEILCRDVLGADPTNAWALNLLGQLATAMGEREKADGYFSAASSAEPGNSQLRVDLQTFRGLPPPAPLPDIPRYLMIRAWGFGFWSDVANVLGALLLAEVTGRTPIVHWGANSLFSDDGARDAFSQYFLPVSPLTLDDLKKIPGADFFPRKWRSDNLAGGDNNKWNGPLSRVGMAYFFNRPEIIAVSDFYIGVYDVLPWLARTHPLHGKTLDEVYRALIEKYLRPQPAILEAVNYFYRANLRDGPFVAAHLRGSDKIIEDENLAANNAALFSELDGLESQFRIFLLTDDANILEDAKNRYGMRLVATDCQRADGTLGVHYRPEQERVKGGREIMIDTYLALRAERFYGNAQSNVAGMIAQMKDWPPGSVTLLGHNQLAERKLPLFIRKP